jgi:hypothetical protein
VLLFNFYALFLDLLLMEDPYDNTSFIFIVILVQNLPSISGIQLSLYLQKNSPLGSKLSELSIVPYITYMNLSFACSYESYQHVSHSNFFLHCCLLLTPYSKIPPPQTPQNSLCNRWPEPLSASRTLGSPAVILNDEAGILVVRP